MSNVDPRQSGRDFTTFLTTPKRNYVKLKRKITLSVSKNIKKMLSAWKHTQ